MNHEIFTLALMAGLGLALGLLFFLGLWATLSYLPRARYPGMVMAASLFGRLALLVTGLALLTELHADRLLAALLGILIARLLLQQRIQAPRGETA